MGTNVYAIRKNPRSLVDWKKAEVAVTNHDPWGLSEALEEFSMANDFGSNTVHLGKRSAGWKFLFDPQDWVYYDHTKESINRFLESCFAIQDEYGDQVSIEEFWIDFAEWNPNGWDGKGYEDARGTPSSREMAKRHGYYESTVSPAGPIPSDLPYRFSDSKDFS